MTRTRRSLRLPRDLVRRAAAMALALLILGFALWSYLDARGARRELRDAGRDSQALTARLDTQTEANRVLADEVRKLQGIIEAQGQDPPPFTFPQGVPGPQGPQGVQGIQGVQGPTSATTTTTTTRPTSTSTTTTAPPGSTTTTRPRPTLPTITLPIR